jgi:hypothetical protein
VCQIGNEQYQQKDSLTCPAPPTDSVCSRTGYQSHIGPGRHPSVGRGFPIIARSFDDREEGIERAVEIRDRKCALNER